MDSTYQASADYQSFSRPSDGETGAAYIVRKYGDRRARQARKDWERTRVSTSNVSSSVPSVSANCRRCGSSLAGRREKTTDTAIVYRCRCGAGRRVPR